MREEDQFQHDNNSDEREQQNSNEQSEDCWSSQQIIFADKKELTRWKVRGEDWFSVEDRDYQASEDEKLDHAVLSYVEGYALYTLFKQIYE